MASASDPRGGWRRYRRLLGLPGVRVPLVLATAGSMPIGMYVLAILLFARDTTGSFAEAGRVAAGFGLANALGAVAQGRLMDRLGQGPVLWAVTAGHLSGLVALVVAGQAGAPGWVLLLCAVCAGATLPQLPAAMRALWTVLTDDPADREAAYALGAVTFEVAVVTAPALVALIVALASPAAAVLVSAALAAFSASTFALTPASRAWRGQRHAAGWLGPLVSPGMRTVFAVLAAFGTATGILQVAVPAFTDERGSAATGGVLLAGLSLGSLLGGVVYGARSWPGALPGRLAAVLLGIAGAYALLALADAEIVLGALLVLGGLLIAPAVIICSTLLDSVAPAGTATEAFAIMIMGIVAGTAAGNAIGGSVVDAASYETAVLTAGGAAAVAAAIAGLRRRSLSPG